MSKLYDKRTEFRLYDIEGAVLSAGAFIEIEEPKEFEALTMKLERIRGKNNIPRHGFNFEYGDAETPLIFIKAAGYKLLQDIFNLKGSEAIVRFELGVYDPGYTPTFTATLDFNTYERTWINGMPRIQVNVESESIVYKLNSRLDTKVNLLTDRNFDKAALTPLELEYPFWHSKVIRNVDENGFEGRTPLVGAFNARYFVVSPEDERENEVYFVANLKKTGNNNILIPLDDPIYAPNTPEVEDFPLFFASESGNYSLDFAFQIRLTIEFSNLTSESSEANLELSILVVNEDSTVGASLSDREIIATKSTTPIEIAGNYLYRLNAYNEGTPVGPGMPAIGAEGGYSGAWSEYLEAGQRVYLLFRYFHDPAENNALSNPRRRTFSFVVGNTDDPITFPAAQSFIKLEADTLSPPERVGVVELYPALNRVLEVTTGLTNPLASSFYFNGCGEKRWLTNGFQIRQFTDEERPPEASFSDCINSLNMIDGVGFGFEKDGANVKVRIEEIDHFYKDAEILKLDRNVYKYEERIADELILNEVVLQFSKYISEELNTLDSFNTKAEWLTPIVTKAAKLELVSQFIADGYAIEYTRREQFKTNPNDSWRYDNDIFIVDWVDIVGLSGARAINILSMPEGLLSIANGTTLIIPVIVPELIDLKTYTINAETFTVESVEFDEINRRTVITTNESATLSLGARVTFTGGFSFKRPETNQAFSTVDNLISPETAYNLRMSMRRILHRHSKWINSGLNWKQSGDTLINTFYDHNKNLQTQLANYVSCTGGDLNRILMSEKADIPLSELRNFARYFVPIRVDYGAELSFAQNEYLRKALSGQSADDNNYGYVSVGNQDGVFTKIFINLHEYKPLTSQVEGWGYKKYE